MQDEVAVIRFTGKIRSRKQPIDEVYYTCANCREVVYDESLPYQEFRHYLVTDLHSSLTCEDCEAKGVKAFPRDCFLFFIVVTPVPPESKRLEVARNIALGFFNPDGEIEIDDVKRITIQAEPLADTVEGKGSAPAWAQLPLI